MAAKSPSLFLPPAMGGGKAANDINLLIPRRVYTPIKLAVHGGGVRPLLCFRIALSGAIGAWLACASTDSLTLDYHNRAKRWLYHICGSKYIIFLLRNISFHGCAVTVSKENEAFGKRILSGAKRHEALAFARMKRSAKKLP